jgi:multidrug resistance efflux pump
MASGYPHMSGNSAGTSVGRAQNPGMSSTPSTGLANTSRPSPMPKRPKGRFLVGSFLLALLAVGGSQLWYAVGHYKAYGAVTGRVLEISMPWGGVVETLHVREGDDVRQGQLLATVVNLELERKLAETLEELRIAQATLEAQVSQLMLQSQLQDDQRQRSLARYYELWGELQQEESRLQDLTGKRQRAERLHVDDIVSAEQVEELQLAEAGQKSKIDKLTQAVGELRELLGDETDGTEIRGQLGPYALRVEALQSELMRLRDSLRSGQITSPVNGRVTKVLRFTGEFSDANRPILEVLVDGSLAAVLYVSQKHADSFQEGQTLELEVPPTRELVKCTIMRLGEQYEPVPKPIEIYYRRDERLLPVFAQPIEALEDRKLFRLGSEVRLPYNWMRRLSGRTSGEDES